MAENIKRIPLPSQEELLSEFRYDADSGLLWWANRKPGRVLSNSCGTLNKNGYMYVRFNSRLYTLHRLIWKMLTGREPDHIDHINGCRIDNRIKNLREVTRNQNNRSIGLTRANRTGYIGVFYSKRYNRWMASISVNKKKISLGMFVDKRTAVETYNRKAMEIHGEFAMRKVQHNILILSKEFGEIHERKTTLQITPSRAP